MKKTILAAIAGLICLSHVAIAQQYVYPVYSQDTLDRSQYTYTYSQAPLPQSAPRMQAAAAQAVPDPVLTTYAQAPAPQASAGYASGIIPLSSGVAPVAAAAPSGSAGYGTAIYGTSPAPAVPKVDPNSVPSFVAATPAPAAMPKAMTDSPHATRQFNWSGCYAGAYLGGAFGTSVHADELSSQGGTIQPGTSYNYYSNSYSYNTDTSFMGGGTFGCNFQVAQYSGPVSGIVLGLEGEVGSLSATGNGIDPNNINGNFSDTHDKTHFGSWDTVFGVRAGLNFNRILLYTKVGAFMSQGHSSITDACTTPPCGGGTINAISGNKELIDPAFGGGIEYALNNAWSVKGEYMYLDTNDSYNVCGAGGGTVTGSNYCSQHALSGEHTLKVGLNYHFTGLFGDRGANNPRW
jgi:outer membrane immunogenic protein